MIAIRSKRELEQRRDKISCIFSPNTEGAFCKWGALGAFQVTLLENFQFWGFDIYFQRFIFRSFVDLYSVVSQLGLNLNLLEVLENWRTLEVLLNSNPRQCRGSNQKMKTN